MKKVLLIEDNKDIRETIAEILALENYEVQTAENGAIGVDTAHRFKPDLIVCDIMMPILDGYGVFEKLGRSPAMGHVPFIFLTAKAEKADMRKGMNLGADDYLTKPFEPQELLNAITARLKKHDFLKKEFTRDIDGLYDFLSDASKYLEQAEISKVYKSDTFEKKEVVFKEGDAANHLFFIESGMIKTYRVTESGKEFLTGIHKDGDFMGQLSLMHDLGGYSETAMVLHKAVVYPIPKADFYNLLYGQKEISQKFMDIVSGHLVEYQEQLADMAFATVRQRVAKTLLAMHAKGIIKDLPTEGVDMAREDLAGLIGIATETAIRTLSNFKNEGFIVMGNGRRLILTDKNGLRRVASFDV